MTQRQKVSSGAKWEPIHGYSRAIRVDNAIYISGTVGLEPDGSVVPDSYGQARRALQIICTALESLGAVPEDVVRTRVFVTDIAEFDGIATAHREIFGNVRPASSMVEVRRLLRDDFLVEIEADAIISGEATHD